MVQFLLTAFHIFEKEHTQVDSQLQFFGVVRPNFHSSYKNFGPRRWSPGSNDPTIIELQIELLENFG